MTAPPPTLLLTTEIRDRSRGALLGLAVGDALGATLEFSPRDARPHHTEMTGGGPFGLRAGEWTDDTAMALALADSLIRCNGLDPFDLMSRFVAWWREGQYSCTGNCFDVGGITAQALARFERTGNPFAGSKQKNQAGNGSLMRVAPVALFSLADKPRALQLVREQSRTTHAAPLAVEACAFFVALLHEAILGKPDVLHPRPWPKSKGISTIASGHWRSKTRDQIRSSGFVADTLEAALWSIEQTKSFEEAVGLAVNLGRDSDTVGAVTGQLAGALYGASAIPRRWLTRLVWSEHITQTADRLLDVGHDAATALSRLSPSAIGKG